MYNAEEIIFFNEMVALKNSNKFTLSGENKSMHLHSPASKIHRSGGCGVVSMRS
jgi:hypothetical protein